MYGVNETKFIDLSKVDYFGGCPECGNCDGHLNVERTHWGVCHTHKTCWSIGSNLFSSWRYETEQQWIENHNKLLDYRGVESIGTALYALCTICAKEVLEHVRANELTGSVIKYCKYNRINYTANCQNGIIITDKWKADGTVKADEAEEDDIPF